MRRRRQYEEQATSPQQEDFSNLTKYEEKYIIPIGDSSSPAVGKSDPQAVAAPSFGGAGAQGAASFATGGGTQSASSFSQPSQTEERPMVFALRSDSTLYVYEYKDRLEYYRHSPSGMMLCNLEYKKH